MKSVFESRYWTVFKYLFFGGSAFVIDYACLYICVSLLNVQAWLGAIIAFAVSTVFAYLTQMRYTFSHQMTNIYPLIKYVSLLLFNMCVTAVIVQCFDSFFQLYLVGKVVATVAVTVWNFPLMKYWIFPKNI